MLARKIGAVTPEADRGTAPARPEIRLVEIINGLNTCFRHKKEVASEATSSERKAGIALPERSIATPCNGSAVIAAVAATADRCCCAASWAATRCCASIVCLAATAAEGQEANEYSQTESQGKRS
jgi:hypothetical protein